MRGRFKGDIVNNWDEKLKGGCRNIRTLGFGIAAFNTLYFNRCRLTFHMLHGRGLSFTFAKGGGDFFHGGKRGR